MTDAELSGTAAPQRTGWGTWIVVAFVVLGLAWLGYGALARGDLAPKNPTTFGVPGIATNRLEGCDAGVAKIQAAANRWDDEVRVASQTPRIALAAQISRMQQVRRDAATIAAPNCLGGGQFSYAVTTLGALMDVHIGRYVDFLGQGHGSFDIPVDTAQRNFVAAMQSLTDSMKAAK